MNLGLGANQSIQPQVSAPRVDHGVPPAEVYYGNALLLRNTITRVARGNLVEAATVGHDAGHGRGGAGNSDAGVVIPQEVVAIC